MDNIVKVNERQEHLFKLISGWGFALFIITGIVGCSVMESGGTIFGGAFVIAGILIDYVATRLKNNLQESGGALTKRKLVEEDLEGLTKEELELLICHIYAKYGYNFNVNDGLLYLEKVFNKFIIIYPNGFRLLESEVPMVSNSIGCSSEQLVIVLENYQEIKKWEDISKISESGKNTLREHIDSCCIHNDIHLQVGYFNSDGKYGHEGQYYYRFKSYDWYKPTINNLKEVYGKMSDIEKYNVEFIKTYESKYNSI